ncbi:hypothetical protein Tco_1102599 [Tanacetum coccineum]
MAKWTKTSTRLEEHEKTKPKTYSSLMGQSVLVRAKDKLRTTKVIKAEFEKLEDLNDEDVSLTCVEVSNIPCDSNKDDDSEQRVSHEADDDMGYDPSDLTDEEFSDNEDEVAEVFRINTNIFDFETPMCKTFNEFNYLLQIDPDLLNNDIKGFKTYEELRMIGSMYKTEMYHGLMRNHGLTLEFGPNPHQLSIIESHEITYHDHNEIEYENETHDERQELCEAHELPVCNMRRFEMIKYSFGQDEEYVAIIEDEYGDLARTSDDTCQSYEEIFRMMDEGWMVTRAE